MAEAGAAGPGIGGQGAGDSRLGAPEPRPAFQIADSRDLAAVARETTRGRNALPLRSEPARPEPPDGWTPVNVDPLAYLKGEVPSRSRPRIGSGLRRRAAQVSRRTWATALGTAAVVAGVAAVPMVGLPLDRPIAHHRSSPTTQPPTPSHVTRTTRPPTTTTAFTYLPAPSQPTSSVPPAESPPVGSPSVAPTPTAGRVTTTAAPRRPPATTAPRRSSTTQAPATTSPPPAGEPDPGSGDPPPYP